MGSAVKQAVNLSRQHQVIVLTCGRPEKYQRLNPHLEVISLPGWLIPDPVNYVISFPIISAFIHQLDTFQPDIVMFSKYMFFTSLLISLAKIKGYPVVTTTDTFPGINWFPRSKPVSAVMWLYARIIGLPLLWLSNKVILLHPGLEAVAKKYRLNTVNIPNGVDDTLLNAQPRPKDIIKPKGEFWIGFVGRPESVKGIDLILKVAKDLENLPRLKFIFIGGSPDKTRLEGNRLCLGFRYDVVNLYQFLDLLVLPSYSEGWPNVLLEAMAQKVPCLASNVGGIPYLIKHKQNGWLIPSGHAFKLRRAILYLYRHPSLRHRLGQNGFETVANRFVWSKLLPQYQELFNRLQ